ncbi:hypothetical protein SELMODRAFT_409722 [Selaginella moellendorffii]|uniref:Uncharacterized protein n=1 Tax=Selaginella moellendorffii TaxID=88036 RepID=D8RC85_SELML|nr:hypothetical protein SELMODRAFT_409722 [Selaginella moellendorffii]
MACWSPSGSCRMENEFDVSWGKGWLVRSRLLLLCGPGIRCGALSDASNVMRWVTSWAWIWALDAPQSQRIGLMTQELLKVLWHGVSANTFAVGASASGNSSKISFPDNPEFKTVHDVASAALSNMGVDARAVELGVKLYKIYFYTTFFCDCKHKLDEVTRGPRLCLVFILSLMQEWASCSEGVRAKMVIPVCHKYLSKSLRFAGLKGDDRMVAALLRGCDFRDLHLCMLTKLVQDHDKVDDDDVEPFDKLHDEENFDKQGYLGNKGGTEYYHVAVLVAWPKRCKGRLEVALEKWKPAIGKVLDLCLGNLQSYSMFDQGIENLLGNLKSAGCEHGAMELARKLMQYVKKCPAKLLEKLLVDTPACKAEALEIVSEAPLECVALAVHCSHEYRKTVEARVDKLTSTDLEAEKLKLKLSSRHMGRATIFDVYRRFLASVVKLISKLAAYGSLDIAVQLASKVENQLLVDVEEELKVYYKCNYSLVLVLPFLVSWRKLSTNTAKSLVWEERKNKFRLVRTLTLMRSAASLLGMKERGAVTALLAGLCASHLHGNAPRQGSLIYDIYPTANFDSAKEHFDSAEELAQDEYNRVASVRHCSVIPMARDFVENVFWFGDEELIGRVIGLLMDQRHLSWKLLSSFSPSIVPLAMDSSAAARNALRKVVEARMEHLRSGLEYGGERIKSNPFNFQEGEDWRCAALPSAGKSTEAPCSVRCPGGGIHRSCCCGGREFGARFEQVRHNVYELILIGYIERSDYQLP